MIQTRPGVLWQPTTYQQLTNAARNCDLSEATLRIEFKQKLGQTPSARKSFAKELASLALDGGVLIVGITDESDRDPDNPMTALNPQPLQGLTDRIEQIAGTVPDPPIQVHCHELRETPTDTDGFVVVQIPASGIGPHMVDGCYYGRVGTQRQPLTDAQVLLHHQSRPATQDRTLEALNKFQQYWSKRPTDQSGQIPAQLYLVAVPAITQRNMAADWLRDFYVGLPRSRTLVEVCGFVLKPGGVFLDVRRHRIGLTYSLRRNTVPSGGAGSRRGPGQPTILPQQRFAAA